MIPRARAALGCPCRVSRSLTPERAAELCIDRKDSPVAVAAPRTSSASTLRSSLTPPKLIGEEFFAAMRPGAFFVNTSRARSLTTPRSSAPCGVAALLAGLDVFEGDRRAGGSVEARSSGSRRRRQRTTSGRRRTRPRGDRGGDRADRAEYKETGRAPNVRQPREEAPATHLLIVAPRDRVGVLAACLRPDQAGRINVQETETSCSTARRRLSREST